MANAATPSGLDVVDLGRSMPSDVSVTALLAAQGYRLPEGVWVRGQSDAATGGPTLSLDDVFDTDIEFLSGLVDRGPRDAPAPSYAGYDSFLFGAEKGKHPRYSLIARDD
jgi:hypothetical protein